MAKDDLTLHVMERPGGSLTRRLVPTTYGSIEMQLSTVKGGCGVLYTDRLGQSGAELRGLESEVRDSRPGSRG